MNSDLYGRWFRSRSMPWVTGSVLDVDLNFLANARQMEAPEVAEMVLVFRGTVTPVGGTAQGEDFAKYFGNCTFRDEAEMVNASGNGLRVLAIGELGSKYVDPADIAVGVATPVVYRLPILFEPLDTRAVRPRDFRVPLVNFLEGGNLQIALANALPTNHGVVAGDWFVEVAMRIVDGRKRELKSRRRIFETVVNQQEFDYQVNGAIRWAIITSNLTTTGYTSLAAFTTIFSRTLELPPAFPTHYLQDIYRRTADAIGSNDEFIAGSGVAAVVGAIPLVIPTRSKKVGQMIITPTLHIDLGQAAPASGRLLLDTVVDRTPNMSALAAGYSSPEELAAAVQARGRVVGEAGNMKATAVPRTLAKKLPIRLD